MRAHWLQQAKRTQNLQPNATEVGFDWLNPRQLVTRISSANITTHPPQSTAAQNSPAPEQEPTRRHAFRQRLSQYRRCSRFGRLNKPAKRCSQVEEAPVDRQPNPPSHSMRARV